MKEYDVPLPRLLGTGTYEERRIRPISASVNLQMTPLSYCSIELPPDESVPARGYIEMFTPLGSAGIYRVRSPQEAYGADTVTAELEHAIVEVGDYIVQNDYDEMMGAEAAMRAIWQSYRGTRWQLGLTVFLGTQQVAVQAKHTRVLEAMLAILNQCPDVMMTFNFSTTPWTVAFARKSTTVTAEGRLSRNVSSARIVYDDTELCTRAYYENPATDASGEPTTTWTYMDADTISEYGIVERTVSTGSKYSQSEAERVATEYLRQHKRPRATIDISAEELYTTTGETWDKVEIGKKFRLALPDYDTTVEEFITALSWKDVYGSPQDMNVRLGDEEDTAVTFLHDLDAKGGSGGGGGSKKAQEEEWKEYRTRYERDDYHFRLVAEHVNTNDEILEQAGLYIDSQGVLQYADDDENMIGARQGVLSDHIFQIVGLTELDDWDDWDGVPLKSVTGSALWNDRNVITGVVGQFDIVTDSSGKQSVVVKSGGGLKVRRNGTEFGVYDNDSLTAGIIVSKINGQDGYTQILGSKIKIGDSDAVTVINGKASIEQLNAVEAKIDNLMAGRITATTLSANKVIAGSITATDTPEGTDVPVGVDADWHTLSNGTKSVRFLGTGDITFDRAAARAEGAAAVVVTLSDSGWIINDASTGDYTRDFVPQKDGVDVTTQKVTVSGQTVWGLGKAKGESDAKAAVTMSGSWSGATYTARNSANSRTATASITMDSGSWSTDGHYDRTITAKDGNTSVNSVTIRAETVYTLGYNAGWAAARAKCTRSGSYVYRPPATVDGNAENWFRITVDHGTMTFTKVGSNVAASAQIYAKAGGTIVDTGSVSGSTTV